MNMQSRRPGLNETAFVAVAVLILTVMWWVTIELALAAWRAM